MSNQVKLVAVPLLVVILGLPQALWAQESATLDTVVVTASRTEEKLREVTTNVTVITEEAIKKSSASTMDQLLRQQGIQVDGYNAGGKAVTLRGMRQKGLGSTLDSPILILLNGRQIAGLTMDFVGLTNVERVEIIRGPAAVQYGPQAMSGVVNIITKRGGEKLEFRAEAGAGSYDLERIKVAASGQSATGLIDFSFGGGQQYQDEYKTGKGWVFEGSSPGRQLSFNGELGINFIEGQRIGFSYNYFGLFSSECPPTSANYVTKAKPPFDSTAVSIHDVENSNWAITYDGSSADKAFTWQGRFNSGRVTDKASWSPAEQAIELRNLTGTLGYDEGGLFALSGGLDYLVYDIDQRGAAQPEYKDFGVFLSGKLRLLDDSLIFSAGGRFDSFKLDSGTDDAFKTSKTNFAPSVGLAYLPVDWLKLRANYSEGFRMPTPQELWEDTYGYSPPFPHMIGNAGLSPEKSKTWEVGLDVGWEYINASLTYFHSKWEDKIISALAGPNTWQRSNLTGATIAGFEFALNADLGQAFNQDFTLRPYVSLTYLPTRRNEDRTGGAQSVQTIGSDTLPFVSKMTMSYGLDFIKPDIDLMFNINAVYSGESNNVDYTHPSYGPPDYKAVYINHTPGTVVDMSVEKGILKFEDMGSVKVRLELNNVFDKYDEAYPSYPGPGRNFYLGMIYEY